MAAAMMSRAVACTTFSTSAPYHASTSAHRPCALSLKRSERVPSNFPATTFASGEALRRPLDTVSPRVVLSISHAGRHFSEDIFCPVITASHAPRSRRRQHFFVAGCAFLNSSRKRDLIALNGDDLRPPKTEPAGPAARTIPPRAVNQTVRTHREQVDMLGNSGDCRDLSSSLTYAARDIEPRRPAGRIVPPRAVDPVIRPDSEQVEVIGITRDRRDRRPGRGHAAGDLEPVSPPAARIPPGRHDLSVGGGSEQVKLIRKSRDDVHGGIGPA